MHLLGIDIGGTKCAVVLGSIDADNNISIIDKIIYPTSQYAGPGKMMAQLMDGVESLLSQNNRTIKDIAGIGISCGGPLDSEQGVILSPPNLPGWDAIPVVEIFHKNFNVPVYLQNDANACALAEWKYGAGRGFQHLIFLTFGTGMGAGLILNGKLYAGACDMAGEAGHVRLENTGPVGYGKAGSFEGFCSGGGIAQLAKIKVMEKLQKGQKVSFCTTMAELDTVTAVTVAAAAEKGDSLAREIYGLCGMYLGKGISLLIDILNPELIIIGSVFVRSGDLMMTAMEEIIVGETLPASRKACRIVPSALGEKIGDYAALSVAAENLKGK